MLARDDLRLSLLSVYLRGHDDRLGEEFRHEGYLVWGVFLLFGAVVAFLVTGLHAIGWPLDVRNSSWEFGRSGAASDLTLSCSSAGIRSSSSGAVSCLTLFCFSLF